MQQPTTVRTALWLILGTYVLGIPRSYLEYQLIAQQAQALGGAKFVFAMQVVMFVLIAGFVYFLGNRKNWARFAYLVMFAIGLPGSVGPLLASLRQTPVSGVLGVAQALMQIAALVLLFLPASNDWFRKPKSPAAPTA